MEHPTGSVPRPTLRDRQREGVLADLRAAAIALFERQGFAATTVDQIAAHAGVSRSTFFRHVGSKESLVIGEMDDNTDLFLEMLRQRPANETRMQALEATLVGFSLSMRSDERRDELLQLERIIEADPTLGASRAATGARWTREVARVLAERGGRTEPDLEDGLAAAILAQITEHVGRSWRDPDQQLPASDLIHSHFGSVRRLVG